MRVTGAVTTGASYCRSGVCDGKLLLRKVDVADMTSAVVGASSDSSLFTLVTKKQRLFLQQQRFIIQ